MTSRERRNDTAGMLMDRASSAAGSGPRCSRISGVYGVPDPDALYVFAAFPVAQDDLGTKGIPWPLRLSTNLPRPKFRRMTDDDRSPHV